MRFFREIIQTGAHRVQLILGFFKRLFGFGCGLIRVGGGRLELQHGNLPLGPCFQPQSLLLGQAGGVISQPSQLDGECRGSQLGLLTGAEGTLEVSVRRLEPSDDLSLLDLAVDSCVAGRFLLPFQVGEPGPGLAQAFLDAHPGQLAFGQRNIDLDQTPLGALDPFLERGELGLRVTEVATG